MVKAMVVAIVVTMVDAVVEAMVVVTSLPVIQNLVMVMLSTSDEGP